MSEPQTHQARVRFLSDWRVGSGIGPSGPVIRDQDGLPFVPAKTLIGVWRSACEQLGQALDRHLDDGPWSRWVSALFGGPGVERALVLRAARYPEPLRAHLRDPRLADALTIARRSVAVGAANGVAAESSPRTLEWVRAGAWLEAELRLNDASWNDRQSRTAWALLVASAALVRRLGGHRRRGAGRCELSIPDAVSLAQASAVLKELAKGAELPEPPRTAAQVSANPSDPTFAASAPAPGNGKEWVRAPLRLTLRSPAMVGGRRLGDAMRSEDHAPGACLLRWASAALSALGPDLAPAIARGDVRVLPAVSEQAAEREFRSHRTAGGDVYGCDALRAGSVLRSELRLRKDLADRIGASSGGWRAVLTAKTIALGRSKNDDYGDAWIEALVDAPEPVPVTPFPSGERIQRLTVVLATDVLLRDQGLRPSPTIDALRQELSRRLGLKRELRLTAHQPGQPRVAAETRRIESWSSAWGLPRPSLTGLRAGSVAEFESDEPIDPRRLAQIEADGIGERRGEGYGLLRFQRDATNATAPSGPASAASSAPVSVEPLSLIGPEQADLLAFARLIESERRRAHPEVSADASPTAKAESSSSTATAQEVG